MSNVVLEGPDGSGKSTLAKALGDALDMRVQQGSGPPKRPGEIERRLREYLNMRGTIFDRHPAVSQVIYATLRDETTTAEYMELVKKFYESTPVLIYCRSYDVSRHVVKDGEDPEHIRKINDRYVELVRWYDSWALKRAHLIYRIGDEIDQLVDIVRVIAC